LAALFFCAVKCLWNGGRHDRLEQPNGTKGTTAERPLDCPLFLNKQIKLIVRICYGTEIAKGCSKKQPFAFKKLTKTKKIYKPINIAQSI